MDIKDLLMGRLCWISQMHPKCNHKAPYTREGRRSKVEGNAVTGAGGKRQCDVRSQDKE